MRATYKGPGDSVQIDGLDIKRGEAVEVTREQFAMLKRSDPLAIVDEEPNAEPETPVEVARIRANQDRVRADAAQERIRREQDAADEVAKIERENAERAKRDAEAATKLRDEREAARREAASTAARPTTTRPAAGGSQ